MKIHAAAISHVGMIRENNEDNFYLQGQIRARLDELQSRSSGSFVDERVLFAVADGMGGMACGELASLAAVQSLQPCALADVHTAAMESIGQANGEICRAQALAGRQMGTTLAALYMDAGKAVACNIGDSRVYSFRKNSLTRLTVDHNQAQQMVAFGMLTEEEAAKHPGRHVLTQFIGIPETEMVLQPHFAEEMELQPGDLFLLCSDGLTDGVREGEMTDLLAEAEDPMATAEKLVGLALERGGRDNITVLAVFIEE